MKNLIFALCMMVALLVATGVKAQQPSTDFFIGKWEVVMELMDGNVDAVVTLEKDGEGLKGSMTSEGMSTLQFDSVTVGDNGVTMYFEAMGYDVDLSIRQKTENEVEGVLAGYFTVKGKRVTSDHPLAP